MVMMMMTMAVRLMMMVVMNLVVFMMITMALMISTQHLNLKIVQLVIENAQLSLRNLPSRAGFARAMSCALHWQHLGKRHMLRGAAGSKE